MAYDVLLGPDGDLPTFTTHITGDRLIAQRGRARMATWGPSFNNGDPRDGEELEDRTAGLPLLDWLQAKPVPLAEIAALCRAEWEAIPGVVRTEAFKATQSGDTVAITGKVFTEAGTEIAIGATGIGTTAVNVSILTRSRASATMAAS